LAFLSPRLAFGQSAPPSASIGTEKEEALVLNPFIVDTSRDRGYDTNNTLSGTRLNTPSKYVGAAITDVSLALMADLGLTNMQDVINFTPNASSYFGGGINTDTNGNGALATTPGASGAIYYVRGLTVTTVGRDFLNFRIPDDAYNLERLSFTRGPNAVLFGIGNPGGIANSVSKRATMGESYQVGVRFDTNGSQRMNFDVNRVILKKKLAIRIAMLTEDAKTNRKPSDRKADRLYGAMRFDPTPSTTILVNGEQGRLNSLVVRPWPASDGISVWQASGSQEIPSNLANGGVTYAQFSGGNSVPPGMPSVAANTAQAAAAGYEYMANRARPTIVDNSSGYASIPPLNGNGLLNTIRPTLKNGERNQTLLDSPIPYTANVLGYGNHLVQNFGNFTININQRIGQSFFLQGTFNRQQTNYLESAGFSVRG
jgi:outer membrane receptor protein involved in Fe transport